MKEKVAVVKCSSYEKKEVAEAIRKVLLLCDVKNDTFGDILLKPNMLSDRIPAEGVTTHPSVIESVADYFNNPRNIIGDSPASVKKPISLYWEKCGYKEVSEKTGLSLVKFNSSFMLNVYTDKGKKSLVPVTDYLKEYKVFNIAKLKTHGLTIMTAAIKNLYGLIPGFHKSFLHSRFVSPFHFSEFLTAYYSAVKDFISFNIVDAVISMEGNGPAAGNLRETGYIIGGRNAVAVDMVCSKLIGVKPRHIPYLKIYDEKNSLPKIEVLGDILIPAENFKVTGKREGMIISNRLLRPYLNLLGRYFKVRPEIDPKICKKCYACKQVCPVKAISEDLKFDRKKCINCLCCFEVCSYKAIDVKKSFIARIFT